ncbi:hypothetical protein [Streptomyces sp. NPDC058572]|uniref:hypothetical protein n=1 Tax=Streptomyces sp. NPDC058572 TaxID=3346546 RepID=UPI003668CEFD
MGVDIHGAIECRLWGKEPWASGDREWSPALGLYELRTGRGDQMSWDCLFGYSGAEMIVPLFDQRGLPDDVCEWVRTSAEDGGGHSASYATWAELDAVDLDRPCTVDGRASYNQVEQWARQPDGTLAFEGFVPLPGDAWDVAGELFGDDRDSPRDWPEGAEVAVGEHVYRPVVFTPRKLLFVDSAKWEPVFSVMRTLAGLHGDDHVRLVVYFC